MNFNFYSIKWRPIVELSEFYRIKKVAIELVFDCKDNVFLENITIFVK